MNSFSQFLPVLLFLCVFFAPLREAFCDPPSTTREPVYTSGGQTITSGTKILSGSNAMLSATNGAQILATGGVAADARLSGAGTITFSGSNVMIASGTNLLILSGSGAVGPGGGGGSSLTSGTNKAVVVIGGTGVGLDTPANVATYLGLNNIATDPKFSNGGGNGPTYISSGPTELALGAGVSQPAIIEFYGNNGTSIWILGAEGDGSQDFILQGGTGYHAPIRVHQDGSLALSDSTVLISDAGAITAQQFNGLLTGTINLSTQTSGMLPVSRGGVGTGNTLVSATFTGVGNISGTQSEITANVTGTSASWRMAINGTNVIDVGGNSGNAEVSITNKISGYSIHLPNGGGAPTYGPVGSGTTFILTSSTIPVSNVSGLAAIATTGSFGNLLGIPAVTNGSPGITLTFNGTTIALSGAGTNPNYLPLTGGTLTGLLISSTFGISMTGNIVPTVDNSDSLGSTALRFSSVYTPQMYFSNNNGQKIVYQSGGSEAAICVENSDFQIGGAGGLRFGGSSTGTLTTDVTLVPTINANSGGINIRINGITPAFVAAGSLVLSASQSIVTGTLVSGIATISWPIVTSTSQVLLTRLGVPASTAGQLGVTQTSGTLTVTSNNALDSGTFRAINILSQP